MRQRPATWIALVAAAVALPAFAAGTTAAADTFLWLAIILLLGRLASMVERFGMPGVLGEIFVGIALGNIGLLGIGGLEGITKDPVLTVFAELGVVILLFQIGLETTVAELRSVGLRSTAVALIGVAAPFALGAWVAGPLLLPGRDSGEYLFIGATLCATSVGISGRLFKDAKAIDSPAARIVLGAAIIDDVLGLVILAVVSGIVERGRVSPAEVGSIVLNATAFLVGALVIGRAAAPYVGRWLAKVSDSVAMKLTALLAVGLGLAWAAHHLGLAPIIGAFAAGVLLEPIFLKDFEAPEIVRELRPALAHLPAEEAARARRALDRYAEHHHAHLLEPLGHFLVPVFFVFTGMQVKLAALADPAVIGVALGLTLVAIAGKLAAGLAAERGSRWLVGWGMVPRGEVGLIFAAIGQQLGVVDDKLFAVIVAMVILTTVVTPPVLAAMLRRRKSLNP